MGKKVIVISLGGSIIIPDDVNTAFLKKFKKVILKNSSKYKFVIVSGGGSLARKYISALKDKSQVVQSSAGISATRANAKFMSIFFGQEPFKEIPMTFRKLKKSVRKNDLTFCGALEFKPHQTTDATACEIAAKYKTMFINITNVSGLYTKNPQEFKDAKFIREISWDDFYKMVNKFKFKPGQHLPLDQTSAKTIRDNKVVSYLIGTNMKNLNNVINRRKFTGTIICS